MLIFSSIFVLFCMLLDIKPILDNKRHFLRKSGKAKKWPTQILLIFTHIQQQKPNLVLAIFLPGREKCSFFTKMDSWGQIWAQSNACHNFFVRFRKYGLDKLKTMKKILCRYCQLYAGDAQAWYLAWEMKKSEKQCNLIGSQWLRAKV